MARMTPAEAAAVDNVINYVLANDPTPPAELVRSLHLLASRAHTSPEGEWHQDAVMRQWPYAFTDEVPVAPAGPTDPPVPSGPLNPA